MRSISKRWKTRKTDTKDAEWIADLLQHGLLKASFIPTAPQRELRELTRYRVRLTEERSREVNRLQKSASRYESQIGRCGLGYHGESLAHDLAGHCGGRNRCRAAGELGRGTGARQPRAIGSSADGQGG